VPKSSGPSPLNRQRPPLIMHYLRFSVLFVLAAAPLCDLSMPLAPLWDDMRVKHTWNAVPANWESLGHPPAGTTIDLHIALKPHRESALIDALYEVSDPRLPTYVLLSPFRSHLYSRVSCSVSDMVHTCPRSRPLS
jgi:hypothetical protein